MAMIDFLFNKMKDNFCQKGEMVEELIANWHCNNSHKQLNI